MTISPTAKIYIFWGLIHVCIIIHSLWVFEVTYSLFHLIKTVIFSYSMVGLMSLIWQNRVKLMVEDAKDSIKKEG